MSMVGSDSSPDTSARRLRFDRYVLDLDRGSLLLDGNEIALRPKTFAVLRYLAENRDCLVSKDDLFSAVWPNVAVTDDALVQSIGELRKALGDAGTRLIKTVPRRGYRFESEVSLDRPSADGPASSTHGNASVSQFVPPAAGSRRRLLTASVFVGLLALTALWNPPDRLDTLCGSLQARRRHGCR